MKAYFSDCRLLDAAVLVAGKEKIHPIIQFMRKGDKLEILGTNVFVMVVGEVDAEFEEWPDGEAVRLQEDAPARACRRALAMKRDDIPNRVEVIENSVFVEIGCFCAATRVSFPLADRKPLNMEGIDKHLSTDPSGSAMMGAGMLRLIAKLMKALGMKWMGWHVECHGKNNPMCFKLHDEYDMGMNVRIVAMPQRERDAQ